MAPRRIENWRAFVAALVVAVGLAVVWGLVVGWTVSSVQYFVNPVADVMENVSVAADGTLVISANSYGSSGSVTLSRRTLDGTSWSGDYEHWLNGAWLEPRRPAPGVMQFPPRWGSGGRIGGMTDGRRPPTDWYIVRDDQPSGHCYLAGYDALSKLSIGFIGRNGFRAARPAADELFALPDSNARLSSLIMTTQYANFYQIMPPHYEMSEQSEPLEWLAYVVESDKVWEIDLRQRTVRTVFDMPGLLSIDTIKALESTVRAPDAKGEAKAARTQLLRPAMANGEKGVQLANFQVLPRAGEAASVKPKYRGMVALRSDDKLVIFDPASANKWQFKLPTEVRSEQISAYWVAHDQMLVQFEKGFWSGGRITQLMWIDAGGKVAREAELKLAGRTPESPRAVAWNFAVVAPVTIAWLVGIAIGAPLVALQNHGASNYSDAVGQVVQVAWLPLIVVVLVAVVLTWVTLSLQRKSRRPSNWGWASFVLLLGIPGFLAYLVEHRRAKLEACPQCGKVVPRDRNACADCDAEFASPARVGTEIFA